MIRGPLKYRRRRAQDRGDDVRELVWPRRGLNTNENLGDQPTLTTKTARNVRNRKPSSRREGGGQRAGLDKFIDGQSLPVNGVDVPVRHVAEIITAVKTVEYAADLSEAANAEAPQKASSKNVVTDRQSNVFRLDGNSSVVVQNGDMTELSKIAIPTLDSDDICRALYVDDLDSLYVGVSSGKDKKTARLFQFQRTDTNKWEQTWAIAPLSDDETEGYPEIDGFIMDVKAFDGLAYVLVSDETRYVSELVQFSGIDSSAPVVEWVRAVPYPANRIAINAANEVIVCAESFTDRGTDPRMPGFGPKVVAWTPKDLVDYEKRCWAWLDASERSSVTGLGLEVEHGDEVLRWADIGPAKVRHLHPPTYHQPPTFDELGAAGLPGIRFDGVLFPAGGQYPVAVGRVLESGTNPSDAATAADQQRTLLPAYENSQFCLFMVVRPAKKETNPVDVVDAACLLHQPNTASGASGLGANHDHTIWANRTAREAFSTAAINAGSVHLYTVVDAADPGQGPSPGAVAGESLPSEGSFDNATDIAIITWLCDGGVDTGISTAKTRSIFRVNGVPYDRWTGGPNLNKNDGKGNGNPTWLGRSQESSLDDTGFFEGHILEIFVLREQESPATDNERVLSHPVYPDVAYAAGSRTEMEEIEAYLAHKWGSSALLDDGASYTIVDPSAPGATIASTFIHPFGPADADAPQTTPTTLNNVTLVSPLAILAKYDQAGKLRWIRAEDTGIGYGVAVGGDDHVYSVGTSSSTGWLTARRLKDKGDSYSVAGVDGAWQVGLANVDQIDHQIGIAVDAYGHLYVPTAGATSAGVAALYVLFAGSGITLFAFDPQSGNVVPTYAVALPQKIDDDTGQLVPDNPDYEEDISNPTSQFAYVAGGYTTYLGAIAQPTLYKVQLVSETVTNDIPRLRTIVALAGGTLKRVEMTADVPTSYVDPVGGGSFDEFAADARYIESAVFGTEIVFVDGKSVFVYRTKEDDVQPLVSTSPGQVPTKVEFCCNWGGRLVLAKAQEWFMSEKDELRHFDYGPPVQTPTQAVAGANALARQVPDVVTSLCALNDDLLLFFCDHSIWRMTGDPMAGGVLHPVSRTVGGAFGRCWCRGPEGVIYFMAQQGGLYMMSPGGEMTSWISEEQVQAELEGVDLSLYRVELAYNYRNNGVHILLIPLDPTATLEPVHYFFEKMGGGFAPWEDSFADAALQIHCVATLDGDDPDDRVLVFGCADGQIRHWADDLATDDSIAIDSYVDIGPLAPDDMSVELIVRGLRAVLTTELDGVGFEWYASDDPGDLGTLISSGSFGPGANPWSLERAAGAYLYLRLRSATTERWGLENLLTRIGIGGPKRDAVA